MRRAWSWERWTLACACCIVLAQPALGADHATEQVTVRGDAAPLAYARRAPSVASTSLGGESLSGAGLSAADVLSRVPGVQITRTGAQSDVATASIRGSDADQVPVYLAGVRLNDEVSGTADLASVPLWLMERVEVFRGNAPDGADRLGIGGAIFFWPRVPRRTTAGGGVGVGSFGERQGWVFAELGTPRAASLVAVRRSGADNDYPYTDDRGQRFDLDERRAVRANADFTQTDAWAIGRWQLGRGARASSVLSLVTREQGVTSLALVPVRRARSTTRRLLFGGSLVVPCAPGEGCRLELETSAIAAGARIDDPALELSALGARWLDDHGERASERARLTYELSPELSLSAGVAAALENLRVRRDRAPARGGNRRSLLPSAGAEWRPLPGLGVFALAALECHFTRGQSVRFGFTVERDSDGCDAEPALRLGVAYTLGSGLELLSNVARYVRAPTLGELYGTSALVDGNPSLRAETGASLDVGLRHTLRAAAGRDALSIDAFAFARDARELVRYRRSSFEVLAPYNVASARLIGLELAAAADLFRHLRLEAAGTLLDARETTRDPALDPTQNDVLPNSARLSLSTLAELYTALVEGPLALSRASLGLRYFHQSSRYADPAGQNVLPEQHFVDVEAAAGFLGETVVLRAALDNLFDAQTSDLIGLPVPGRSYHLSLALTF